MTRITFTRRALLASGAGMAGILSVGRAPAIAQTQPKKLVFAHVNAAPESAAINFEWMAKEVNTRSKGALDMQLVLDSRGLIAARRGDAGGTIFCAVRCWSPDAFMTYCVAKPLPLVCVFALSPCASSRFRLPSR
jgi:ferredoxin-NADP reductase